MRKSVGSCHPIRRATKDDAAELARLFSELGHPTSEHGISSTWESWSDAGNVALVCDQSKTELAGVATLNQMHVLHRPKPVGRISALTVDARMRGKGIGRALVAMAEATLAQSGCGLLEITSNSRLIEAHKFYEHLGYQRTSIRLAKAL